MAPVRVKLYGLLSITRRSYLWVQFIGFLLAIAMIVIGVSVMNKTDVYFPHWPASNVQDDLVYQLLISLFWFGLLILIGGSIETIVMLRKFARVEAQQKAQLAALEAVEPAVAPPSSTAVQPPPAEIPNTNIQP